MRRELNLQVKNSWMVIIGVVLGPVIYIMEK